MVEGRRFHDFGRPPRTSKRKIASAPERGHGAPASSIEDLFDVIRVDLCTGIKSRTGTARHGTRSNARAAEAKGRNLISTWATPRAAMMGDEQSVSVPA
jgi:hypothetical protein